MTQFEFLTTAAPGFHNTDLLTVSKTFSYCPFQCKRERFHEGANRARDGLHSRVSAFLHTAHYSVVGRSAQEHSDHAGPRENAIKNAGRLPRGNMDGQFCTAQNSFF